MFSIKPDRALAAGIVLLAHAFTATPALATEAAPVDDAVLRQSTAPTLHEDRGPDDDTPKSEQPAEPGQQDDKSAEVSQIVRPTQTELRTTTPELPLGFNIRPAATGLSGLADPGTNVVFSATLSNGPGLTTP